MRGLDSAERLASVDKFGSGEDSLDCFRFFRFFRIDPKKIELLFKVNNSHPRQ